MRQMITKLFAALAAPLMALALLSFSAMEAWAVEVKDPENAIQIEVGLGYDKEGGTPSQTGIVVIELLPEVAPNHVKRIKDLAREGFYDGVPFHRVIEGFMAQTGDGQNGNGTGGSSKPDLQAEFNDVPYKRGTVGMARTNYPHSANSQFFITFGDASFLNGQYTVFGQVVDGMDVVDSIKRGVGQGGSVPAPTDMMVSVKVLADIKQ
ncbi:MAG: peptidylprolyl isomerase [Neomegalonema sp.]|nr:peptidylprolyl isomerase [Neomegalonema sp.]